MDDDQGPRLVDNPACWLAADLAARPGWCRTLTDPEIAELVAALRHAEARHGLDDLAAWRTEDFPLPRFGAALDGLRGELVDGCGVTVLEGFPVQAHTKAELRALWWGIGLHLGTALAQSSRGDVIGDVRDLGTGISGKAGRGYTSNVELGWHSDAADVTALFFLRQGATGGTSGFASSVAVHNELLRRRPDLMDLLYQPMPVSWQSNQLPGERPWYEMPVYGRVGEHTACAYVSTNVLLAHRNAGAPPLTAAQEEAVRAVGAVAREPEFGLMRHFGPGTMLFVNNHTVFHLRTAFTDDATDPEERRHLLRLFLCLPNGRELPRTFAGYFRDVRAGMVRGGYPTLAAEPVFHTA
ncbi:MAG: TauD/TfdA family dioxygenase [Acidimicrobiia bacterium]